MAHTEHKEESPPSFVDLLPPKQRHAIITTFGDSFAKSAMGPIAFIEDANLSHPTAINFYERDFPYVSRVLNYEYQYRSWYGFDQELLNRYESIITKKLEAITTLLTGSAARIGKLMETNGVKVEGAVYSNALQVTVPLTSGHARAYFKVLQELDRLYLTAGNANLYGVITSSQRADLEFSCKKAVRAFAAALRNEVNRLYKEATRVQRAQQGIGQEESSQATVIESQGQTLTEFGHALDEGAARDSGLNLGGEDPGQIIDDAATASAAASKASSAKTRAKKAEEPASQS